MKGLLSNSTHFDVTHFALGRKFSLCRTPAELRITVCKFRKIEMPSSAKMDLALEIKLNHDHIRDVIAVFDPFGI